MPDRPSSFSLGRTASPDRPLQGLTVLAVEDSRFASEALRLMCLRSGARLRRADCIAAAWRHLHTYRPEVLIVDLGLPDGPGTELIAALAKGPMRPQVILAISGDGPRGPEAMTAGADAFVEKPLESLGAFRALVLRHLSAAGDGPALVPVAPGEVPLRPDPIALRDDLAQAARMLEARPDGTTRRYLAGFLGGLALSAHDPALARAAAGLATSSGRGVTPAEPVRLAARLVRRRLHDTASGPLGTGAAAPAVPGLA